MLTKSVTITKKRQIAVVNHIEIKPMKSLSDLKARFRCDKIDVHSVFLYLNHFLSNCLWRLVFYSELMCSSYCLQDEGLWPNKIYPSSGLCWCIFCYCNYGLSQRILPISQKTSLCFALSKLFFYKSQFNKL